MKKARLFGTCLLSLAIGPMYDKSTLVWYAPLTKLGSTDEESTFVSIKTSPPVWYVLAKLDATDEESTAVWYGLVTLTPPPQC